MGDDRVAEEREEEYALLIDMLRRDLREPAFASSLEQSSIIARVQERLTRGDGVCPRLEELPQPLAQSRSDTVPSFSARRRHLLRFVRDLAAVLVVAVLVGAALLVFTSHPDQSSVRPPGVSTGTTAVSQYHGLTASIHVLTPGSYFLGELVSVDVGLTNGTGRPFELDGSNKPDIICFSSALSAEIAGGSAPTYTLPTLAVDCLLPLVVTMLAPGQTLTLHDFVPITKSGEVTITMSGMRGVPQNGPLAGRWPSVSIHVDPQVPSNRVLSLRSQGAEVVVQAPPAAQGHLLYMESITCDNYGGESSRLDWSPLPTLVLSQPTCPTGHKHWEYIVSAPGYAIGAGSQDS